MKPPHNSCVHHAAAEAGCSGRLIARCTRSGRWPYVGRSDVYEREAAHVRNNANVVVGRAATVAATTVTHAALSNAHAGRCAPSSSSSRQSSTWWLCARYRSTRPMVHRGCDNGDGRVQSKYYSNLGKYYEIKSECRIRRRVDRCDF